MGLPRKLLAPPILLPLLVLSTAVGLCAQKALTLPELSAQRSTLDGKVARILGVFSPSHVGPLLKDKTCQVAARFRFENLPQSARKQQVVKDSLYRKLFELTNSIPDPDQPKPEYEIELLGLVKILKAPNYDVYKESPIEIYPLHVLRVISVTARDRAGARVPPEKTGTRKHGQ